MGKLVGNKMKDNIDQVLHSINAESFDALENEEKFSLLDSAILGLQNEKPLDALEYSEQALLLAYKMQDALKIANIHSRLSTTNYYLTQYHKALKYSFQALEIYEKLNEQSLQATTLNNIASTYYMVNNCEKAIYYNIQALEIHRLLSNKNGIALTQVNLGIYYDTIKQYESAEANYSSAIKYFLESNNFNYLSYAYHNLGMLYFSQCKYHEALEMFNKSLILRREYEDIYGQAFTLGAIASTYFELKEDKKGLEAINLVLEIIQKHDFPDIKMNTYDCLIKYYSSIGDFANAFHYKTMHCKLHQTQIKENSSLEMEKLHFLHELEVKEIKTKEVQKTLDQLKEKNDLLEQTKKALNESELKYRNIVDYSTCIVLEWDTEGNILYLNDYGLKFFGFPASELIGKNVLNTIVSPIDSQGNNLQDKMKKVQKHPDDFYSSENENVKKDSTKVWIAWTNKGIFDHDKNLIKTLSVGIDRTQQHENEIELIAYKKHLEDIVTQRTKELEESNLCLTQALAKVEKSEKTLKSIMENLQDAFFQADLEGKLTYANQTAAEMYGYSSPEEFIGKPASTLYANENERSQVINQLKQQQKISNLRIQGKKKDGSTFWVSMNVQFIYDNMGQITGTEGLIRDITDRKKAEDEIMKLNETLEERVLERTKQLEESNKALEAFSHSISHDLRAPLRSIVGFSQILIDDYQPILGSEGSRLLQIVIDNTKTMDNLINGLLKLSKATYVDLNKIKVDMNQVTANVISNLSKTSDTSKASFQINQLLEGYGDPTLINQVWFNLLANALKFSSKHPSPLIQISSYKENNHIVYSIKDNGAGFNPEFINKLFTIFNRLHPNNEFEGTGVGLALVKRIIQKHGGTVWAESTEGAGATFYFSLPQPSA